METFWRSAGRGALSHTRLKRSSCKSNSSSEILCITSGLMSGTLVSSSSSDGGAEGTCADAASGEGANGAEEPVPGAGEMDGRADALEPVETEERVDEPAEEDDVKNDTEERAEGAGDGSLESGGVKLLGMGGWPVEDSR